MVARIAAEPINAQFPESRARQQAARTLSHADSSPLPPVPQPMPAPAPAPPEAAPGDAFAAARLAEEMPLGPSATEITLRRATGWQPPESALRLADLSV